VAERALLAARIAALDADVLAVPEVEDLTTLTAFADTELAALGYRHVVLMRYRAPYPPGRRRQRPRPGLGRPGRLTRAAMLAPDPS